MPRISAGESPGLVKMSKLLTTVKITFEHIEYAFKPWKSAENDYQWINSLAQQSSSKSSKLSKIKLVEMRYSNDDFMAHTEDFQTAFEEAGIMVEQVVVPERP